MNVIKHQDWLDKAAALFGKDPRNWKFVCPMCKTVQTPQDLLDAGVEKDRIDRNIGFSCIGRFVRGKGCDWTLGGLFRFHTTEIELEDGKLCPVFEFAENKEAASAA